MEGNPVMSTPFQIPSDNLNNRFLLYWLAFESARNGSYSALYVYNNKSFILGYYCMLKNFKHHLKLQTSKIQKEEEIDKLLLSVKKRLPNMPSSQERVSAFLDLSDAHALMIDNLGRAGLVSSKAITSMAGSGEVDIPEGKKLNMDIEKYFPKPKVDKSKRN